MGGWRMENIFQRNVIPAFRKYSAVNEYSSVGRFAQWRIDADQRGQMPGTMQEHHDQV